MVNKTSPTKETELSSGAPEVHPVNSETRLIQVDIEQMQALVLKLDAEKGIEGNDLCNKDYNKLKGVEWLIYIEYESVASTWFGLLWHV